MEQGPLVTIVTPCLNAAPFIARTVESVLNQDYPHIEYIVMDGGSSDGTVDVLEAWRGRLEWASAPDGGAADAINRGFLRSHGTIFGWLNADDTYRPGAISAAVRSLVSTPEAAVVYGQGVWTDAEDRVLGVYPTVSPYDAAHWERECFICQPAAFMTRRAFEAVGMLDPHLQSAFDYDLWIRLSRGHLFVAIQEILAASRMHPGNKSLGQRRQVFQEAIRLLRRHFGFVPVSWIYGYLSFLRDGRDQYFQPLRHSAPTYLASLPVGSCYNYKHVWRYWREWASNITARNLKRVSHDSKAPVVKDSRDAGN
jgi:glycosyltransferase involved in cell wall biosynthesis